MVSFMVAARDGLQVTLESDDAPWATELRVACLGTCRARAADALVGQGSSHLTCLKRFPHPHPKTRKENKNNPRTKQKTQNP